jgi:hypothetical protein
MVGYAVDQSVSQSDAHRDNCGCLCPRGLSASRWWRQDNRGGQPLLWASFSDSLSEAWRRLAAIDTLAEDLHLSACPHFRNQRSGRQQWQRTKHGARASLAAADVALRHSPGAMRSVYGCRRWRGQRSRAFGSLPFASGTWRGCLSEQADRRRRLLAQVPPPPFPGHRRGRRIDE